MESEGERDWVTMRQRIGERIRESYAGIETDGKRWRVASKRGID